MNDYTPYHLKEEEMEWDHHHDPQELEENQIQEMTIVMIRKVFIEHLGPEGTLQGSLYQTCKDYPMLNSGQKY